MIIGEAPGEQEELRGVPFVGASGELLRELLAEAGIEYTACSVTNVFLERPPNNDLTAWCVPKKELPRDYSHPPLASGKYLHPDHLPAISRLWDEIAHVNSNLLLLLGGTATWAVLSQPKITPIRGVVTTARGWKVLPTFHPAAVLRMWDNRPIVVADLQRAARESRTRAVTRVERTVFIPESPEEILPWIDARLGPSVLAVDVETSSRQISVMGFATSPREALSIPILRRDGTSVWTHDEEIRVWRAIREILLRPVPKVFQNGVYDIQYIWRIHGLAIAGEIHDTMLLHHAMFPEMKKSLGFLGSIYTDAPAWKTLRDNFATSKREDE